MTNINTHNYCHVFFVCINKILNDSHVFENYRLLLRGQTSFYLRI